MAAEVRNGCLGEVILKPSLSGISRKRERELYRQKVNDSENWEAWEMSPGWQAGTTSAAASSATLRSMGLTHAMKPGKG